MSSLVLLSLAALAASSPLASSASGSGSELAGRSSDCSDVHIFLARGNNEPYPGRQSKLVSALCSQLTSCSYEDLQYSALYTDFYCQTVYDGTIAGHVQMAAYANKCPDAKLILSGYSQGAQIAIDILGGAGAQFFGNCTEPDIPALSRDSAPGSQLAAVIAFGDVRHTASQSFNYGNGSSYSGLYPRTGSQLSAVSSYSSDGIVRDWCVSTDPICASNGPESYVADHLSYFDRYSDDAASWIMSVASLTADASATTTSIPISVSGTAQVYSTIATDYVNPQTEVTTNSTWMSQTSVTVSASKTGSSSASKTSSASASDSTSASTSASAGITASANSTATFTSSSTAAATFTNSVSASSRTLFSVGSVLAGVFAAILI